jgi:hypothetical protein
LPGNFQGDQQILIGGGVDCPSEVGDARTGNVNGETALLQEVDQVISGSLGWIFGQDDDPAGSTNLLDQLRHRIRIQGDAGLLERQGELLHRARNHTRDRVCNLRLLRPDEQVPHNSLSDFALQLRKAGIPEVLRKADHRGCVQVERMGELACRHKGSLDVGVEQEVRQLREALGHLGPLFANAILI